MISIIICSKKPELASRLSDNICQTIGIKYEVITIKNEDGKLSICQAYNIGASKAQYKYLCFVHEDILFHTDNWGQLLLDHFHNSKARLIGILGCVIKTQVPSSTYIPQSNLNRHNQLQRYPNGNLVHCYENPLNEEVSKVAILDGMFMACTRKSWQETYFSDDYLTGFHGYDIDFSLKNDLLGSNVVVYDILIEHSSFGNYNMQWIDSQLLMHNKWNKIASVNTTAVGEKEILLAEMMATKELLRVLINNNYLKRYQLKLLVKLMIAKQYDSLSLFFIRKVILGNFLDLRLKRLLKKFFYETSLRTS